MTFFMYLRTPYLVSRRTGTDNPTLLSHCTNPRRVIETE